MQNKQIKFQLEHLGLSKIDLFKTDIEEFEILVKVDGGVSERLIVNDGDLCLVCTMEWNIGEFKYYIPPKTLYTLLSQKPFNEINSSDLFEYNQELWETKSGNLTINSINDFDLEDIDQISIILEGTDYELTEEEKDSSHDQLRSIIEDKMHSLYSKGNIDDSEIDFSNLHTLEIKNYDNASVSTSWWSSYLDMASREANNKNYLSAIEFSFNFLSYELNTSIENYTKEFKKSELVPENISSTLMQISTLYEDSNQYEKAIEYYLHYLTLNPNNDFATAHIGSCYDKLEQIDNAIKFYKKAVDLNPHNIFAVTQCADILVKKKEDVESALKVLNDGIQNNPTQPKNTTSISWLFRLKGEIYYNKNNFKQALDPYKKAIEVDKMIEDDAFIFLRLAIIHYNLDQYKESIKSFYKCFDLDGETYKGVYSYYYLAESLKNEKLYEESANYFQLVLEQNNENYNPYAYQGLGFVKLKLKDYSSSISAYQKADKNKWNHQNLGKAFFGLGEYLNSLNEFNNVIEIDPKYKWSYHWKGDSHFQLGEFDEALKAYEKLIELSSNYIDYDTRHIGRNIALLYHYFEKYEKAIYYYNEFKWDKRETLWKHYLLLMALKKDKASNIFKNPKEIQFLSDESLSSNADKTILDKARLNRVISKPLYQEGENNALYNHEICLNDLSIILKSSPNNYEALYQRANILSGNVVPKEDFTKEGLKIIDLESSKKDLIECIKINNFSPAFKLLITIENDNVKLISEVVSNGNKLFKDDWSWWLSAAKSMKKIKQLNKSKDYFLKTIKYHPENSESYYEIGNIYLALDEAKNSIKFFKEAIQIANWEDKYRIGLCDAYLLNSNVDLAEKEIKNLIIKLDSEKLPVEKIYYDQYVKVLEEKNEKPNLINLFREYISETWSSYPSGILYNEDGSSKNSYEQHNKILNLLNENLATFLNKCDNMKSNKEYLFEHWEVFKETDIENYLKNGSYQSKFHLSKNKSLTKKQLLILLENGSFSILENVVANPLFNKDELKEIILEDDLSYQYSYKLMGTILNPNADQSIIESLKNNSFNWVKKLAYSKVEKYSKEDLNDKYKLLGLIENDKIDKILKPTFHKKLKLTEGNNYTIKFNDSSGSMLEYVYSEFEYEEIIDELTESILSDDEESWYDHCSSNWYNYGDSEYGLDTSILEISINSSDLNNSTEIYLGERETFDRFKNVGEGRFIFEATSYEAGEYVFEEMTLEFEFRPEFLNTETSDYKMLINGIEYNNPVTDEDFYSSGELVESRTKGTDIELFFKNKNGEGFSVPNYEDLQVEIEETQQAVMTKETIHSYFKK